MKQPQRSKVKRPINSLKGLAECFAITDITVDNPNPGISQCTFKVLTSSPGEVVEDDNFRHVLA